METGHLCADSDLWSATASVHREEEDGLTFLLPLSLPPPPALDLQAGLSVSLQAAVQAWPGNLWCQHVVVPTRLTAACPPGVTCHLPGAVRTDLRGTLSYPWCQVLSKTDSWGWLKRCRHRLCFCDQEWEWRRDGWRIMRAPSPISNIVASNKDDSSYNLFNLNNAPSF